MTEEFRIGEKTAVQLANKEIKPHFDKLKDTCYLLAETSYVDKVYRDSYYHYYSSKLNNYKRSCVRLSVFEGEICEADFKDATRISDLQDRYRGFIILRPIEPFVIGRNVLSPKALKHNTFLSCSTEIETTVNSIKFKVEGFPHSSQDTETITCAETTLWAIMEYFGNKYSEYQTVLPSKIIQTLNKVTIERQLPSRGLTIQQMSFALRQFGFGTRIYSRQDYGIDFNKLLSTYLESGIPVICGIDNRHIPTGNIGHALLCVGHDQLTDAQIDTLPKSTITNESLRETIAANGLVVYDWDEACKDFIFVDDNYPVYQRASLDTPTLHYPSNDWRSCTIKHFIVPLYPKIYLEAYQAKNFVFKFLVQGPEPLTNGKEVLIRFFLSSSRSFKDSLSLNTSFSSDVKDIVLEMLMPKFIWVAEISNKSKMKQGQADGIVILDATEANIYYNKPLIMAAYQSKLITLSNGNLESIDIPLSPFKIYTHNLKNL